MNKHNLLNTLVGVCSFGAHDAESTKNKYVVRECFTHSAFTLGYEAGINKSPIDGNLIPHAALIRFVQKGIQYLEMEANLSNSDTDVDEDFSFLQPMDLITKDAYELRRMVKEKRECLRKDRDKELERQHEGERKRGRYKGRQKRENGRGKDRKGKIHDEKAKNEYARAGKEMVIDQENKLAVKNEGSALPAGIALPDQREPMDVSTTMSSLTTEFSSSDVTILEGHTSEVCACGWSPAGSLLASGSGDSTARIWTIADRDSRSHNGPAHVLVLKHVKGRTNEKGEFVTTIDWNGEGKLLATGSYDGQARIWNADGELKTTLSKHKGAIFSLKWNKKGDYILTGSCDETAIVWDVKAGKCKQHFDLHSGPILDVDWRNNVTFATSSTDKKMYVWKVGESNPIRSFAGHQGEVNCVKWDPTGSLLASCSDDGTAKIWNMKQETCIRDLKKHSKAIFTIRWSPTGPGSSNPHKQLVLASASFDSTVKIWNVELGKLLCSLNGHRDHVYSIAFSPNGEYLASGSLDKSLHIWSLKEEKIAKTFNGNGAIFEVCWNKKGDRVAACFGSGEVCVLDFKM
ncbi:hypothetical protein Nepgr_025917 [Nepenthes gracilis]|uniref:Uncharacterized protein n=1 Tax=Nepenthes gracilis TaxID=150966 RepID=A0AAD3Y1J4_NEPGR|nr:hypothetical protein Nepgr_025917 [Nepenthes gracilis]